MAKLKIKKGDLVQVISGRSQKNGGDRGKQGKVIALDTTANLMAAHPGGSLEDVFVRTMNQ